MLLRFCVSRIRIPVTLHRALLDRHGRALLLFRWQRVLHHVRFVGGFLHRSRSRSFRFGLAAAGLDIII